MQTVAEAPRLYAAPCKQDVQPLTCLHGDGSMSSEGMHMAPERLAASVMRESLPTHTLSMIPLLLCACSDPDPMVRAFETGIITNAELQALVLAAFQVMCKGGNNAAHIFLSTVLYVTMGIGIAGRFSDVALCRRVPHVTHDYIAVLQPK